VFAVLAGFFLPWVALDVREGKTAKSLSAGARRGLSRTFKSVDAKGDKQPSWIRNKKKKFLVPSRVSGYQVPGVANQENAKVVMALSEVFTRKQQRIGLKSYAVYFVPGLALLCGALLGAYGENSRVVAGVAAASAAVVIAGLWALLTTDTRKLYAVSIGPGLWLSLAGYAVVAIAAGAHAVPDFWGKKRAAHS
jgi:hypothetical protein